jgi:UDP-GlcNAc:undecaprenyl-phosphate/decaprenyl-phosphate GlcNAc-1-phosphate transferase
MNSISLFDFFVLIFSTMATVGMLTHVVRNIARHHGIVDVPSENHKTHSEPVPYLGGIAIAIGVLLITITLLTMHDLSSEKLFLAVSVLIPSAIMATVGLVDDIKRLSPWLRFIFQSVFGIATSAILLATDTIGSPFGFAWIDVPISILWIIGITNAVNFFDNIDGGASGALAIASGTLVILALQGSQILIASMAAVVCGATLGFLLWNKPPARIYMGDAGSLFLGILIASLTIRFDPSPIDKVASFAIPVLLLAMPILDTSVAITSRVLRKISPFQGGRDHLSHRLLRIGLSKRQSVLSLWAGSLLFAFLAIAISFASYPIERLLTYLTASLWLILFIMFLRMPDQ